MVAVDQDFAGDAFCPDLIAIAWETQGGQEVVDLLLLPE
jgi:hypothetical protein